MSRLKIYNFSRARGGGGGVPYLDYFMALRRYLIFFGPDEMVVSAEFIYCGIFKSRYYLVIPTCMHFYATNISKSMCFDTLL